MKKLLFSLLAILMAFSLVHCSSEVKLLKPIKDFKIVDANIGPGQLDNAPLSAGITFTPSKKDPNNLADATFKITVPTERRIKTPSGFKTQALPVGDIAFVKIEVTGLGIATPLWANGADGAGRVPNVGGTFTLVVNNVPYGNARVATVTAYNSNPTAIPGAVVKATFNVNSAATAVELFFRQTPGGDVVQNMFGTTPNDHIATTMNLTNLQVLIDNIIGIGGASPNYTYTTHPSLVNSAQIASDLLGNGGNSLALDAANTPTYAAYKITPGAVQFSITGLIGPDTAAVRVQDPASVVMTALANGGPYTINGVTPGTWNVEGAAIGYVPDTTPSAVVTAGNTVNVGTINFSVAAAPSITSLSITSGTTGTTLTVDGNNFHGTIPGNTLKFGTVNATVTAASTTQLTATVPAGTFGTEAVTVTVGGQTSNSINFDVTPNISGLSVGGAEVADSIQVNGSGFDPTPGNNTVKLGVTNVTVTAATNTQLTITVPNAPDGNITVQVGSETSNGVNLDVLPSVSITAPADSSVVNGNSLLISALATGGNPLTHVRFYLDGTGGTLLNTDVSAPFNTNFDTTSAASGAHTLVAQARDNQGNETDSVAINITIDQPPNIASTTPTPATAPGLGFPVQIVAAATDDLTALVDARYNWTCTANCGGGHTFDRTDSNTIILHVPTTNVGPITIQVAVDDTVNTPVTDSVVVNYASGTASANVVGTSTLEEVSTYAGDGTNANTDGSLLTAQFTPTREMVFDSSGNLYVIVDHGIRKISPEGIVSTLAGSGTSGSSDGTGAAAQFNVPMGIAIDSSNNLYVADKDNDLIRKVTTPGGVVTTFAGDGTPGYNDATGTSAQFDAPISVAVDSGDNVFVADRNNRRIRKITPGGVVTTFAGDGTNASVDGTGVLASFQIIRSLGIDTSDNLYAADQVGELIRKITPGAVVTTLAGSTTGFVDGTGAAAQFSSPSSIVADGAGNVYVAETGNDAIRKVTPAGVVTTVTGTGTAGDVNGLRSNAQFTNPIGLALGSDGLLYISDSLNHKIKRIKLN